MVDKNVAAAKIASIRDAVTRIRAVVPADADVFVADRTAREVVALNLLVAIQDALDLGTHWLADEGLRVPASYREVFVALASAGVIDRNVADQLVGAAFVRNLIAHRYGEVDWKRVHAVATGGDLAVFDALCAAIASRVIQ